MNSPKKVFYGLLGLVGLIIAGGAGTFYLFDTQLSKLNQDVSKLLAEQEAIGNQITLFEDAEEKIEELSFVQDLSDEVLPSSKQQANVVAELKKFIVDAGLQFDSVTFSGSELGSGGLNLSQTQAQSGLAGVRILPATAVIRAGASYSQVIDLLRTIENNQRKMQVTDIALTPESGASTFSSITVQIDVYVRADQPAAATDADNPNQEKR